MLKQIKLLSIMALVMTGTMQADEKKDLLTYALNMGNTNAATLAVAAVLAEGAYCYSQRDFNKDGYKTIGGEEDTPVSDAFYCLSYGTAETAIKNIVTGVTDDATWQGNAEKSLVNSLCFWITKQITRQDAYKNLNRNSFLLRWVPDTNKVDDGAKYLATLAIVKMLVGKIVNSSTVAANVPAAAAVITAS